MNKADKFALEKSCQEDWETLTSMSNKLVIIKYYDFWGRLSMCVKLEAANMSFSLR